MHRRKAITTRIITQTLKDLSAQQNIEPQVILQIEGIPFLFSAIPVTESLRFDSGYFFDDGLRFDSVVVSPNSRDVIQIEGTTRTLTQQINIDRGGKNSLQRLSFKMIDPQGDISETLSNGNFVTELLGTKATCWISFKGAAFPEDAIRIVKGLIDEVRFGVGTVRMSIAQADRYKRKSELNVQSTELLEDVIIADSVIKVLSAASFIEEVDILKPYLVIQDEILRIDSIDYDENEISVTRAMFGTAPDDYDSGEDVNAAFLIEGNPIDIALKLMISGSKNLSFDGIARVRQIGIGINIPRAIFFPLDITRLLGVTEGDFIDIESGANEGSYLIVSIISFQDGVYCLVDSDLEEEQLEEGISFRSKYNTLPIGASMTMDDVDVVTYERQRDFFGTNIVDMSFFVRDAINIKDFIEDEIHFPLGLYSIVRDGRSSVAVTAPALSQRDIIELNLDNAKNPQDLQPVRSLNQNYYNTIVYKYNKSRRTDNFLTTDIAVDAESLQDFGIGESELTIESSGYRRSSETREVISQQSRRFLDRYRSAPRLISGVGVLFGVGFKIDVGDTVIVDGEALKIKDPDNMGAFMGRRIFEVVNRELSLFTGSVRVDLLETNFRLDQRFGVFSPASIIESATSELIVLKDSFITSEQPNEVDKWTPCIGSLVRIRSEDYSFDETTTLVRFSAQTFNGIEIEETPGIPTDAIIELPLYTETSDSMREQFTFLSKAQVFTLGASDNIIEVSNVSGFFVEQAVEVVASDYSAIINTTITAINGNDITLADDVDSAVTSDDDYIQALEFVENEKVYGFY